MSNSEVNNIRSAKFDGVVWNVILSNSLTELIVDVRKEQEESISYLKLDIKSLKSERLDVAGVSWRSRMDAYDDDLFVTEYPDEKDPTNSISLRYGNGVREEIALEKIPSANAAIEFPMLYEPDSEYHRTVRDFLGLDIVLSCEYLEVQEKIIISYYLRSGKEFVRHLLVLADGKKEVKEIQDKGMKGFASGAFFVFKDELFFVKDRNEICVFPL